MFHCIPPSELALTRYKKLWQRPHEASFKRALMNLASSGRDIDLLSQVEEVSFSRRSRDSLTNTLAAHEAAAKGTFAERFFSSEPKHSSHGSPNVFVIICEPDHDLQSFGNGSHESVQVGKLLDTELFPKHRFCKDLLLHLDHLPSDRADVTPMLLRQEIEPRSQILLRHLNHCHSRRAQLRDAAARIAEGDNVLLITRQTTGWLISLLQIQNLVVPVHLLPCSVQLGASFG